MEENKRISIYVSDDLHQWLQDFAKEYDITLSTAVLIKLNELINE